MSKVVIEVEDLNSPSTVKTIEAWEEYNLDSSLFDMADDFTIRIHPTKEHRDYFKTGGHVARVYLDGILQMTGIVDAIAKSSNDSEMSLTLTGRDFGGLLVDDTPPMITYYNRSLKQLIEALIANHSQYITSVITDNAANRYKLSGKRGKTGKKSPVYRGITTERSWTKRSKPGDKIADLIKQMAQEIACHVWMTADGALVVARPQYNQDPDTFGRGLYQVCDKAGNITDSNCHVSWDPSIADRFSHWNVTGQGTPKASLAGKDISERYCITQDPSPGFYTTSGTNRLHKENNLSLKSLQDKKMTRRLARTRLEKSIIESYDMRITVNGHRPFDTGPLWAVDTMVNVRLDPWGVNKPHYVIGRVFNKDPGAGETTELELIPANIWLAIDHDVVNDSQYYNDLKELIYW